MKGNGFVELVKIGKIGVKNLFWPNLAKDKADSSPFDHFLIQLIILEIRASYFI